jgi:hypothetical protein
MRPPPLAVIAHGKLSFPSMLQIQSASPERQIVQSRPRLIQPVPTRSPASPSVRLRVVCAYLSCWSETRTPRLRNFDTELPSPYCYRFSSDNRLESVANAHTAADLHVRPVPQTALVSRAVGAANSIRDTSCLISRNGNDSARVPSKSSSRSQNHAAPLSHGSKVLNLRADSKRETAVIFPKRVQNKFINWLRLRKRTGKFQTTARRYADK